MTRQEIEQLNEVEPYCFETDREEQWYRVGLQEGLSIADSDPISPWISVNEKLPPVGEGGLSIKVIVVSTKGKIDFSRYDYDMEGWISPSLDIEFTHWMPIPEPPKSRRFKYERKKYRRNL